MRTIPWDALGPLPAQALYMVAILCVWTIVGMFVMKYFARRVPLLNHAAILFWATLRVQIVAFGLIYLGRVFGISLRSLSSLLARILRRRLARDARSFEEVRNADKISGRGRQGRDNDDHNYIADRRSNNRDDRSLRLDRTCCSAPSFWSRAGAATARRACASSAPYQSPADVRCAPKAAK